MSNSRTRMAAVAGSLALSLSMVSVPAVLAQDGPEATIESFMAAVEAKDFEALPGHFCTDFADQLGVFDLGDLAAGMPPGIDAGPILDAIILDTELTSLEVLSQSDTEAIVHVEGSMSMDVDFEAMMPFVEALLEAFGVPLTPEALEEARAQMMEGFTAESTDISEDITMVPGEAMPWLICDDLGAGTGMPDEDMSGDDMSGDDTPADATSEEDDGE